MAGDRDRLQPLFMGFRDPRLYFGIQNISVHVVPTCGTSRHIDASIISKLLIFLLKNNGSSKRQPRIGRHPARKFIRFDTSGAMCHKVSLMKIRKDVEIKARIDGRTKAELWRLASSRELDLSDIVREALRDLLRKQIKPSAKGASAM
jgi:hypothetical protein